MRWIVRSILWVFVGLGWVVAHLPRWVPNLARFTRRAAYQRLHAAWVGWMDQNFGLIERGAPWLDRTGEWVFDHCHTHAPSKTGHGIEFLVFPRPYPQVRCEREVTVVYGFDGGLPGRLLDLVTALAAAGWAEDGPFTPLRDFARSKGRGEVPGQPIERLPWSPVPGFDFPQGLTLAGGDYSRARRAELAIGWISSWQRPEELRTASFPAPGDHGPRANLDRARRRGWPARLTSANGLYQPVQVGSVGVEELAGRAIGQHEHAVAIRMTVLYYYPWPDTTYRRFRWRLRPVIPTLPF